MGYEGEVFAVITKDPELSKNLLGFPFHSKMWVIIVAISQDSYEGSVRSVKYVIANNIFALRLIIVQGNNQHDL